MTDTHQIIGQAGDDAEVFYSGTARGAAEFVQNCAEGAIKRGRIVRPIRNGVSVTANRTSWASYTLTIEAIKS